MSKITCALDVDGVVADFHSRARELLKELFGLNLPIEDFKDWDVTSVLKHQKDRDLVNQAIAKPGFCKSILPFHEALEVVPILMQKAKVYFATTPHDEGETWMWERRGWLVNLFNTKPDRIIHTHDKEYLDFDIFVDDKPHNVSKWKARYPNRHGLLMDAHYNRAEIHMPRINNLKELLHLIEQL